MRRLKVLEDLVATSQQTAQQLGSVWCLLMFAGSQQLNAPLHHCFGRSPVPQTAKPFVWTQSKITSSIIQAWRCNCAVLQAEDRSAAGLLGKNLPAGTVRFQGCLRGKTGRVLWSFRKRFQTPTQRTRTKGERAGAMEEGLGGN